MTTESDTSGWGFFLWSTLFVTIVVVFFLYLLRSWWLPTARAIPVAWPTWLQPGGRYSFLRDREAGFSSDTFDLAGNIESGDARQGLDAAAKREIRNIMTKNPTMTFDQARAQYTKNQFASNNIGPDGRPLDPRAVFFS